MYQNQVRSFFNDSDYLKDSADRITIRSQLVKQFLGTPHNIRILDIGCGDGSLSLPLLNETNSVTFIDIAENMLETVRKKIPDKYRIRTQIIHGSFDRICDDEKFDVVICVGVIAHVTNVSDLWTKICSILEPDGLLIVETTPNPFPMGNLLLPYYYFRKKLKCNSTYKKNRLSIQNLRDIATSHNLAEIDHVRFSFPLPTMSHWPQKLKLKYTKLTLTNPILSKFGCEHIFLFKKRKTSG